MKKILTIALILISIQSLKAQVYYEEEEPDSLSFFDKVYFGGNFSLSVSRSFTYIDVSPLAGYMITPDFSAGLGVTYSYLSREYYNPYSGDVFKVNGTVYGGRVFMRHNIFDNYFAHVEYENLNAVYSFNTGGDKSIRGWVPGFFVGGGIFQPVFGRGGVNVTVLYNLLYDRATSPYNNAFVFRVGVTL